ncbi:MAG: putative group XV phospholipase A2 [Streblomastix strix]|uniref:Putative group XV phospholipase A2 n=1 Tax=Streblomastix strix TaxID=222440 RepID=A0A5J4VDM8_9EUKA|nr:MAG: putative group XV phospholipase A2 [Streblomastix strix]
MLFIFILLLSRVHSELFAFEGASFKQDENIVISPRNELDPVILVPGLAGSRLEYREFGGHDYKHMWLDFVKGTVETDKYIKLISPNYNSTSDIYSSAEGIEVRPTDFGGIKGISSLDPTLPLVSDYFAKMINTMQKVGYEAGQNLFGAPYDFRIVTPHMAEVLGLYNQFKGLVEKAYSLNDGKKVHLVGHSCGCAFIHQFLTIYIREQEKQQNQKNGIFVQREVGSDWADKYIESFISISGPYGGAPEALSFLSGPKQWMFFTISAEKTNQMVKYMGGVYWMLPNANYYKQGICGQEQKQNINNKINDTEYSDCVVSEVEIIGDDGQVKQSIPITIDNMTWLFDSTQRDDQSGAVDHIKRYIDDQIKAPGVKVHIFNGAGVDTIQRTIWTGKENENKEPDEWWKKTGREIKGKGDSCVPSASLRIPLKWKDEQEQIVDNVEYEGTTHFKIMSHKPFIEDFMNVISR